MAAVRDALAHALNAAFRIVQAYVHKADNKSVCLSLAHRRKRVAAGESCFDGKALVILEILASSANHLPSRCYSGPARVGRVDPLRDGIGFEEIVPTLEFQPAEDAALAGAVRTPDDCQDGHALGGSSAEFTQDFVVSLPRRSQQITDLKSLTIGLLHNL